MKFSPAHSLTEQPPTILLYHYWNPTEDSHFEKQNGAGQKLLVSLSRCNEQWLHIGLGSVLVLAAVKMCFLISWKEESVYSTTLRWAAEAKPCIFGMKWHTFRLCKATHLLKLLMCLFCLQLLSFLKGLKCWNLRDKPRAIHKKGPSKSTPEILFTVSRQTP